MAPIPLLLDQVREKQANLVIYIGINLTEALFLDYPSPLPPGTEEEEEEEEKKKKCLLICLCLIIVKATWQN